MKSKKAAKRRQRVKQDLTAFVSKAVDRRIDEYTGTRSTHARYTHALYNTHSHTKAQCTFTPAETIHAQCNLLIARNCLGLEKANPPNTIIYMLKLKLHLFIFEYFFL